MAYRCQLSYFTFVVILHASVAKLRGSLASVCAYGSAAAYPLPKLQIRYSNLVQTSSWPWRAEFITFVANPYTPPQLTWKLTATPMFEGTAVLLRFSC